MLINRTRMYPGGSCKLEMSIRVQMDQVDFGILPIVFLVLMVAFMKLDNQTYISIVFVY